jgi:hypothetical protein
MTSKTTVAGERTATWIVYECIGHTGPMEARFRELGSVNGRHQPDAMLAAFRKWCPMDEGMQRRIFVRKVCAALTAAKTGGAS